MADQKYSVELDFVLSPQAKERIKAGVTTIQQEVQKAQQGGPTSQKVDESILKPWREELKKVGAEIDAFAEKRKKMTASTKTSIQQDVESIKGYLRELGISEQEIDSAIVEAENAWNQSTEKMIQDAKDLRRETRLISREIFILKDTAQDLDDRVVKPLLAIGTVITGSIVASAVSYINKMKESNEVTQDWRKTTLQIEQAQMRIGEVAARSLLPYYQKLSQVARDIAGFIERNPGVIEAGIKIGATALAIGTIGKAVTSGIRLYADLKMDIAADKNLLAAQLMLKASGQNLQAAGAGNISGGASGIAGILGKISAGLVGLTVGATIADRAFDAIEQRDVKFADYINTVKQAAALNAKAIGDWIGQNAPDPLGMRGRLGIDENLGNEWFKKIANALGLLKDNADEAADALNNIDMFSVANSPQRDAILNAYEDLLADEKALTEKYHSDRKNIVQDALQAELNENKKYTDQLRDITSDLTSGLSKLARDFANANAEAEIKFQQEYSNIVREGNEEIARIQNNLQEQLEKIERDHAEKRSDLLASRDAVGLLNEKRRYLDARNEAKNEASKEIKERREETARRLEELRVSYAQEKAERLREYQERVAELRAQAAERTRELQEQHRDELARIRLQRVERLKELDSQYKSERDRRYQYFLHQVRELDAALLGESNLRKMRQTQMLNDLDLFLSNYRNKWNTSMGSLSTPAPIKDAGGYVDKGLYRMAWDGQREFVMSGPTTKAAERIIGRQLNQDSLLSAMSGMGGMNATYVDQRKLEAPMSKEQIQVLRQAAIDALSQVIGGK